jgi:preprotein translocase subunit Sec63
MSDEVTVSSLPHPISMFFLGIFAITMIVLFIEMNTIKKEKKKEFEILESMKISLEASKRELNERIAEISKKIDSRVDKAVAALKNK